MLHPETAVTLAPTGSGRRLQRLQCLSFWRRFSINIEDERPRLAGLVLVPTRELALQEPRW
jgi:superfamily II DNA/RNA helicase